MKVSPAELVTTLYQKYNSETAL